MSAPEDPLPGILEQLLLLREPLVVTIYRGGWTVQVQVRPDSEAPRHHTFTDLEQCVLESFQAEETLTAEQIAELAGYPNDSHLRRTLSELRRRGLLGGTRGSPGYTLVPGALGGQP